MNPSTSWAILAAIFTLIVNLLLLWPGVLVAQEAVIRPGPENEPTQVRIAVVVLDLDSVDGAAQSFDANVYYEIRWRDERLVQDGPGTRFFNVSEIWTPRVIMANRERAWPTMPDIYEVTPNGEVTYIQRIWGSFMQPLDLRDFPFDAQTFSIVFVSVNFDQSEVRLVPDPIFSTDIADRLSVPDWRVLSSFVDTSPYKATSEEKGQPSFTFTLTAKRIASYYVIYIILPLILIVAMSWMVFWVDPTQTGTRISVAITSMLTLIAYRFAVAGDLPHVSYLTRMDLLMVCSTALVFSTLVAVVVTSTLARHGQVERARKIDNASCYAFPGVFAIIIATSFFF